MKPSFVYTIAFLIVGAAVALWTTDLLRPTAYAATQASGFKEEVDRGGQVIVTTATAQYLTVPANARHATLLVKDKPVCWGFNPTSAPTASSGGEWPVGAWIKYDNDRLQLASIRVISCAEGAATLKVHYTGDRRIGD